MEDPLKQIEQIETLITSKSKEDKSFGYSTLLHLQEQSCEQPLSAIQALGKCLRSLLSSTVSDVSDDDEEIAAQALKCLGFMIYHPSLVVRVTEDVATLVVQSLVKLIMTTKMKAVCNLGVWCISIQQFTAAFLASHFNSLLRAVIYALDNPIGSLSTTFEAIQALMKLAAQLGEKMRVMSYIWTPLIYRRLLSIDKRERDMTERCFMKIRSVICPPPVSLSKAFAVDLKKSLLSEMKEMVQNPGRKLHAIQAWGWFICLLGPHALKNRHLVNEMLKIPEQTFSDSDPKVQIASLSSWKGLIDALIFSPLEDSRTEMALGCGVEPSRAVTVDRCQQNHNQNKADDFSRSTRLIMMPLVGIMSSKCEVSVHLACLNTWCYLLHKLDHSVNLPSAVKMVLEPILDVVFQIGPDSKNILVWNPCLDLLDEFVSAKFRDEDHDGNCQIISHLSAKTSLIAPSLVDKYSSTEYLIKWLPWDLSILDFHLKMVHTLINVKSTKTSNPEFRSLACNAAVRIFRSTLKGIQNEWKKFSINYKEIMKCLTAILGSIKRFFEDLTSREFANNDFLCMLLHLIEAVREELEPSLLASPLYKVALDLKYINDLQLVNDFEYPYAKGMDSINYMDVVSPMLYLTILYLCISSQSISNESQLDIILQGMEKQLKFMLSSYNPLENLCVLISFLYKQRRFSWIKIWRVIANCLKEHVDRTKATSLKIEIKSDNYVTLCWFLAYPIVVCFCPQKLFTQENTSSSSVSCLVFSHSDMELEHILDVWRSLYSSVNCSLQSDCPNMNCFAEDLCGILINVLKEDTSIHDVGVQHCLKNKNQSTILLLFGEVAVCFLKQILIVDEEVLRSKVDNSNNCGCHIQSSDITECLEFVSRFMRLSLAITKSNLQAKTSVTARVFSALASIVCRLRLKKDILLFMEMIFDPLAQWLSACALIHGEIQEISIMHELQIIWADSLNCLRRSQPPIIFDSSFLKIQASILETTLNHPISAISDSSIAFWNHTYGVQTKLDYPQSLIPILDKLSRQGRISIHKKKLPMAKDHSSTGISVSQRYKVATTHKRVSKRVEFMEDPENDMEYSGIPVLGSKRKRLELTECQKEVRSAQQGKKRDCNGHGPGFRTYTNIDFSQGNDDSQESQELRNPESILELLKRV